MHTLLFVIEGKNMEYMIGNENDLEGIIELYKQLVENNDFLKVNDAYKIWNEIQKYNIKYFLAKENGKIIGSCYICVIPNLTYMGRSIGYIENVIIDKSYRRKGVGKNLMEMAINYAKENNCYRVVLQSGLKRIEAHKFYENIGFNGESKKAYEVIF